MKKLLLSLLVFSLLLGNISASAELMAVSNNEPDASSMHQGHHDMSTMSIAQSTHDCCDDNDQAMSCQGECCDCNLVSFNALVGQAYLAHVARYGAYPQLQTHRLPPWQRLPDRPPNSHA